MIPYNFGEIMNNIMWIITGSQPGVCGFMMIAEHQFCRHESFICLQNNILVMLRYDDHNKIGHIKLEYF